MSDHLREELEEQFASANLQSKENINENINENITEGTPQDQTLEDSSVPAPKSYPKEFQESFKSLSPEWQEYLLQREKQVEKGFSELGNKVSSYKWSDQIFEDRKERLQALGYNGAKEYIQKLISIDDALYQNPAETLKKISDIYGTQNANNNASMTDEQRKIWENINRASKMFEQKQNEAALFDVRRFENAVTEDGRLKHPFFKVVGQEMIGALKSGAANDLEEAYQKALWLNSKTREKMIDDQISRVLEGKFSAAQKAAEASFSPSSKTEETPKELSLREELEAAFRKEI